MTFPQYIHYITYITISKRYFNYSSYNYTCEKVVITINYNVVSYISEKKLILIN